MRTENKSFISSKKKMMLLDILQLEELDYPEMHVLEIEDEIMIKTCEIHDHRYTIITPNDIVIPPTTLVITFKTISWKTFFQRGNNHYSDLDQHNTTLIIGSNGAGKSTVLDALTFVCMVSIS